LVGTIGYSIQLGSASATVRYVGTFFVPVAAAGPPLALGWLSNNLGPHYVRATGIAMQVMFANCAAFVSTFSYLEHDKPRYTRGHAINLGMMMFATIPTSLLILFCKWENRQRAEGKRDHKLHEQSEAMLGSLHPNFKYTI